jgi:hypothetical protein
MEEEHLFKMYRSPNWCTLWIYLYSFLLFGTAAIYAIKHVYFIGKLNSSFS